MRSPKSQQKMIKPIEKTIINLLDEGNFRSTDIHRLANPVRFGKGIQILFDLFGKKSVNTFFWDQQIKSNGALEKSFDRPYAFSTKDS